MNHDTNQTTTNHIDDISLSINKDEIQMTTTTTTTHVNGIPVSTRGLIECGVCFYAAMLEAKEDNVEIQQAFEEYGHKEMSLFAVDVSLEVEKMWDAIPMPEDYRPHFAYEFCPAIVAQVDWAKSMPLYCSGKIGFDSGRRILEVNLTGACWEMSEDDLKAKAINDQAMLGLRSSE